MLGLLLLSIFDYTFKGNWYFVSQWLTIANFSLPGLGSQPNLHRCAGTGFGLTCTGLVHVVIIVTSSYVHLLCCVQKTFFFCSHPLPLALILSLSSLQQFLLSIGGGDVVYMGGEGSSQVWIFVILFSPVLNHLWFLCWSSFIVIGSFTDWDLKDALSMGMIGN